MSRKVDPEAMAGAYDAIRDGEFNGLPPRELPKALMKSAVNDQNDGYETLGSTLDPGTRGSIRIGERIEQSDRCSVCDWRHTYEVLDSKGDDTITFCPRSGETVEGEPYGTGNDRYAYWLPRLIHLRRAKTITHPIHPIEIIGRLVNKYAGPLLSVHSRIHR